MYEPEAEEALGKWSSSKYALSTGGRDFDVSIGHAACGPRTLGVYKDKLLVRTGNWGGLFRYPPGECIWETPFRMEGGLDNDYMIALDKWITPAGRHLLILNPDWTVDIVNLTDYIPSDGVYPGTLQLPALDSEKVWMQFRNQYKLLKVNVKNQEVDVVSSDSPNTQNYGIEFYDGNLYVPSSETADIMEYDPDTDTWSKIAIDRGVNRLRYGKGSEAFWAMWVDGRKQGFMRTPDFTTFDYYQVPSPAGAKWSTGDYLGQLGWSNFAAYRSGNLYQLNRFQPYITALRSMPFIRGTPGAWYRGRLWIGVQEFSGTDHRSTQDVGSGHVEAFRMQDLIEGPLRESRTVLWDGESISAGDATLPLVTAGWEDKSIYFYSDTAGTLTLEADVTGDGTWRNYLTRSVDANTLETIEPTGNSALMRLSFDTAATVTAKAVVN